MSQKHELPAGQWRVTEGKMEIPEHPALSLHFIVALKIPADSNRPDSQEWLFLPLCLFGVVNPKTRCEKPFAWLEGTTQGHPPKRHSLGRIAQLIHHTLPLPVPNPNDKR